MAQLAEVYRPQTWSDVAGQDKVIARLTALAKRGYGGRAYGGRAYMIYGASGTGKTTIGRLIARAVAGPLATDELNAADVDIDYVRRMESRWSMTVLSRPGEPNGRAYLFNEAHLMRKAIISRLLTTLEMIPPHVAVVFTTTIDQDGLWDDCSDTSPLLSRCLRLDLARRDLTKPFSARLVTCARAEGLLNGKPDSYYLARAERLLKEERNNLRAGWQRVESGYLTDNDHESGEMAS